MSAESRGLLKLGWSCGPPVVERTFDSAGVEKMFGHDVRHTIEPEITYRYRRRGQQFFECAALRRCGHCERHERAGVWRDAEAVSRPVKAARAEKSAREESRRILIWTTTRTRCNGGRMTRTIKQNGPLCGSRELISWRLTQKYFFNQTFGGAVINGRRKSSIQH